MVRRLFSDPAAFFAEKTNEPGLRRELLLLFVIGALGAAGLVYVSLTFLEGVAGSRDMMRVNFVGKALAILFGPYALWLFYGGLTQASAYLMNSRGPVSRLLKITAWSLVPMAVANVVFSVAMFIAYRDEDVPADPEGTRVSDQIEFLFELANDEPVLIVAWIVTALAAVAAGYLLSIGVQSLRDLPESQARKAVVLPVIGHLAFVAYTLLTQLGVL